MRDIATRTMISQEIIPQEIIDAGVIDYTDPLGFTQLQVWAEAMHVSRAGQVSPMSALSVIGDRIRTERARLGEAPPTGGGARRPAYSVPLSLRTIPDYESLAQESRNELSRKLGRDAEEYELNLLADKLGGHYTTRNTEMISADKARWNAAMSGHSEDVPEMVEVPNPGLRLQGDIENQYGAELDRLERGEDQAQSRRLLVDALTRGTGMLR
jgi:hypothetical protein